MNTNAPFSEFDAATWQELYRLAFARFSKRALWNLCEQHEPSVNDALVAARHLRIEGNLVARGLAERLEMKARAAD